jgi:peptidoglycan hydrolase CwlO-like protein
MNEQEQFDADVEQLAQRIEIEMNALQVLREKIVELNKKIDDLANKVKNGEFDE